MRWNDSWRDQIQILYSSDPIPHVARAHQTWRRKEATWKNAVQFQDQTALDPMDPSHPCKYVSWRTLERGKHQNRIKHTSSSRGE